MRGPSGDPPVEAAPALACRHALAAIARWLHHEHIFRLQCRSLDRGPAGRAADLLFRHIEDAHRQRCGTALPDKVLQCVIGQVGTRFHVVDTRPEHPVALAAEDMRRRKAADGVHGIEMTEDQDPLFPVAIPGRLYLEDVAVAVTSRRAGGAGTQAHEIILDNIHQSVDRSAIVARRLDLHPAADAGEDLLAVEGRDVGA